MAGKQSHEYPPDDILAEKVVKQGCVATAAELSLTTSTLRSYLVKRGLPTKKGEPNPAGRTIALDTADLPESDWTPERLLAAHGLDRDEWRVVRARANRWGDEDDLRIQLRIDVEPLEQVPFRFPEPADFKPLPKVRKRKKAKVKTAVILSDFHAPHHDKTLFDLTCQYLADQQPDQIIVNGDLMDAATVSRHRVIPGGGYDNPLQENIDAAYFLLRQIREVCPPESGTEVVLLRGNHDERIEHTLIDNVASLYRIRAAGEEVPALSLRNLLRLDELAIDYLDTPWDRAKTQVLGNYRLASRHGHSVTKNPGPKVLADLAASSITGHSHRLSSYFLTSHHPEDGPETRVAWEAGCMCEIEDGLGYAREPNWQRGFLIAHSWQDDDFTVAPAIYLPGRLLLPDGRRYAA
jgi:predicted phosphodiesterase